MDFGGMLKKAQEMQQKMMEAKASLKNIHNENSEQGKSSYYVRSNISLSIHGRLLSFIECYVGIESPH